MKKTILLFAIALTTGVFAQAQDKAAPVRRTPEERLKTVKEKEADLKLNSDQVAKNDAVFLDYFKAQDKIFDEMKAAGSAADRISVRDKLTKLAAERDEKLKKIFTEEQFKKWKETDAKQTQRSVGN